MCSWEEGRCAGEGAQVKAGCLVMLGDSVLARLVSSWGCDGQRRRRRESKVGSQHRALSPESLTNEQATSGQDSCLPFRPVFSSRIFPLRSRSPRWGTGPSCSIRPPGVALAPVPSSAVLSTHLAHWSLGVLT